MNGNMQPVLITSPFFCKTVVHCHSLWRNLYVNEKKKVFILYFYSFAERKNGERETALHCIIRWEKQRILDTHKEAKTEVYRCRQQQRTIIK